MNRDEVKGKAKDALGRAERQVGEWTDDSEMQSEGAAKQVEGKVQKGVGKVKEAGKDIVRDVKRRSEEHGAERKDRKDRAA